MTAVKVQFCFFTQYSLTVIFVYSLFRVSKILIQSVEPISRNDELYNSLVADFFGGFLSITHEQKFVYVFFGFIRLKLIFISKSAGTLLNKLSWNVEYPNEIFSERNLFFFVVWCIESENNCQFSFFGTPFLYLNICFCG